MSAVALNPQRPTQFGWALIFVAFANETLN